MNKIQRKEMLKVKMMEELDAVLTALVSNKSKNPNYVEILKNAVKINVSHWADRLIREGDK